MEKEMNGKQCSECKFIAFIGRQPFLITLSLNDNPPKLLFFPFCYSNFVHLTRWDGNACRWPFAWRANCAQIHLKQTLWLCLVPCANRIISKWRHNNMTNERCSLFSEHFNISIYIGAHLGQPCFLPTLYLQRSYTSLRSKHTHTHTHQMERTKWDARHKSIQTEIIHTEKNQNVREMLNEYRGSDGGSR